MQGLGSMLVIDRGFQVQVTKGAVQIVNCTKDKIFESARLTAHQCSLIIPDWFDTRPDLCRGGNSSSKIIIHMLLARIALTILSRPSEPVFGRGNPVTRPACWEPDMARSWELYNQPGLWDVSD